MMAWLFAVVMTGMGTMLEPSGAKAAPIFLDMTPEQVVALLGEPDRKAILEGKVLRTLTPNNSEIDLWKNRLVFIYDRTKVQVWFKNGRVTEMTKDGLAVLSEDRQVSDQERVPRAPKGVPGEPRER